MYVYHIPIYKGQKRPSDSQELNFRQLGATMWVLGIESRPSIREISALTVEPLQPLSTF